MATTVNFEFNGSEVSNVNVGTARTVRALRASARYEAICASLDVPDDAELEIYNDGDWERCTDRTSVRSGSQFRWALTAGDKGLV